MLIMPQGEVGGQRSASEATEVRCGYFLGQGTFDVRKLHILPTGRPGRPPARPDGYFEISEAGAAGVGSESVY